MNLYGYETITTFWQDFSIADAFGSAAIQDTFNRAFKEWKSNYKYLTELVLVLNWKLWEHYEQEHEQIARLYEELWRTANGYAQCNLCGDELRYFLSVID